jgi:hypothetical protein
MVIYGVACREEKEKKKKKERTTKSIEALRRSALTEI